MIGRLLALRNAMEDVYESSEALNRKVDLLARLPVERRSEYVTQATEDLLAPDIKRVEAGIKEMHEALEALREKMNRIAASRAVPFRNREAE